MKCLLLYSSVTGNTKAVAEAIHGVLPPGTPIAPVHKAPDPGDFDFLALGFWVRRAMPDPRMLRYMERVHGKRVAWFGTLAAWPHSPHAAQVRENTNALLRHNTLLGGFLCQGRLEPRRLARLMDGVDAASSTHPMTEERRARLLEAARHPNEEDFAAAGAAFQAFLEKMPHPPAERRNSAHA